MLIDQLQQGDVVAKLYHDDRAISTSLIYKCVAMAQYALV
jgi:hypothetical protein